MFAESARLVRHLGQLGAIKLSNCHLEKQIVSVCLVLYSVKFFLFLVILKEVNELTGSFFSLATLA